ncbi:diacylglycerol kinase family protein [Actinoplanes sp. NPDC049596]|uniref:diacylglycerol kinase family protein n=1 Tax=unclassified Actinoplanes TaxID=2626549 RepID=UPI003424DC51
MTSNEIAVLANPSAGRGRHRDLLPRVLTTLSEAGAVRVLEAHSGAEAESACHAAVAGGAAAVVAVGGDGTVHRALQAVAATSVPFGVVPAGTGNDFAAGVGVPPDVFDAAAAIASAIVANRSIAVDLARMKFAEESRAAGRDSAGGGGAAAAGPGLAAGGGAAAAGPSLAAGGGAAAAGPGLAAEGGAAAAGPGLAAGGGAEAAGRGGSGAEVGTGAVRWFGAVLAGGFDALVNERANRMRWPRGPRRYDLAILLELARLRPRVYELEIDGADHGFTGMLVAVGNCASYGGGMRILPGADPYDGLLDVVVAVPFGRLALARLKPRLNRGTHVTDPRVRTFRANRVKLRSEGIIGYADGERVGPLALDITCVPGAVRLLR